MPETLPILEVPSIWGPLWAERGGAIQRAYVEASVAEAEVRWLLGP